tara:strand:- start:189 stop:356 length:168 start_codon:yes stop_codon:yes gene_type:complete
MDKLYDDSVNDCFVVHDQLLVMDETKMLYAQFDHAPTERKWSASLLAPGPFEKRN